MFLREIARPLLATWFVYGGVESVVEPERRAARAADMVDPVLKELELDVKTVDLVKLHGLASIVAASALAVSKTPRTAGLALAGLTVVTLLAGRPFWNETDEAKKEAEKEIFLRNVSLLGGTLIAATAGNAKRKPKKKTTKVKAKDTALGTKKFTVRKRGA